MPKLSKLSIALALSLCALFTLVVASPELAKEQSSQAAEAFTETTAAKLLSQLAEGLRAHSSHKMLSVFELSHMEDAPLFRQQITAFFSQYDSIRVHFKLVEVKDNTVIVDAQMEASTSGDVTPPQRKSIQLRFSAEKTTAGWKFVDVQPRAFFS